MEKLLFFDIDGTISYPGNSPASAVVEAIRNARANGHKVFLSTGRTRNRVPKAVMDIGFDGGIFSAGGIVMYRDTILSQNFMPEPMVRNILSLLKGKRIFYRLETEDGDFQSENGSGIFSQLDMNAVCAKTQMLTRELLLDTVLPPLSAYDGQPVYKISYFNAEPGLTERVEGVLKGFAELIRFDGMIPDFPMEPGEISACNINKGVALQTLCHHLGKTEADCIAFGDSMNDASILRTAGVGIAMGNAEAQVKNIADMVCDSCENDGVAKALYELHLAIPPSLSFPSSNTDSK